MKVIKNLKCPKCKKPIPYRTLKLTEGRCNHCGYIIASSILKFANNGNKKLD
ncbi:MAG: hypothetical protein QXS48_00725 [Candidatus Aenigmatarchaeota archaeon]